jgi:hypothetical protein
MESIMKIMGRVVFQNMKGAEAAEERIRAAGYETHICWDVIDVYSSAVYMEIFKDFDSAFIDAEKDGALRSIIEKVDEIVGPNNGECIEAGQVPDDYVPHSEDDSELFKTFERLA